MNALLLIDIQNDFLPGGALAVPHGDSVIPVANRAQEHFEVIIASQDWHPADHGSFAANYDGRSPGEMLDLAGVEQILWPVHCVQHTFGAGFATDLNTARVSQVFQKGTDKNIDSYSAFFDNGHTKATGLGDELKRRGVSSVYVLGLATDYCVKFSSLDSLQLGFETYLIEDGCRGVNLQAGDADRAITEMCAAGVRVVQSDAVGETL